VIPGLLASAVTCFALGALALSLVWPASTLPRTRPLLLAASLPLGAGLCAVLMFLWLLAAGPTRGIVVLELVLIAGLAYAAHRRFRAHEPNSGPTSQERGKLLPAAFTVVTVIALAAFVALTRQYPHGDWDAWMDWNMRARMILRAGPDWRVAFSPLLPWSHPDYPLLLQSLVVRSWLYAGGETLAGPALVALIMSASAVAVLVSSLRLLRSPSQGWIAGLILVSTPFFLEQGAAQYADVPLSCFLLLILVFLACDGAFGEGTPAFAALAGLSAGLALWTKNEGALFLVALVLARGILVLRHREPALGRTARAFLAGLGPMLCLVAYFKLRLAPPNDLISGLGPERTLSRVADPTRYAAIGRAFKGHIAGFGGNGMVSAVWLLITCLAAAWISDRTRRATWLRTGSLALLLILAGHALVYLTMSDELPRHLNNSLDRLLLQLWPSALFLLFSALRTPEEASEAPRG
jgi:Dolichyl-phosphate-mannose-protein mannosyltransferase